ncbi:hypothetical protein QQS21_005546 [Conoideocrella luteorostrata]|uniref:Carbohydrate kinase PfkB domain-containing protein n=1 Tax=Conoideocrella luteorostrata TaxID=1105319 RepID=A0AAJ0CPL4_9HYPO|nr:hypothetical protein QQS21_005546 [Conoideocrella luteorostrata]
MQLSNNNDAKIIAIIGGLDADLIMITRRIPDPGESVLASHYLEALGGKGANSAIGTYRTCHKKLVQNNIPFDLESLAVDVPADESLTVGDSDEDNNIQVKIISAVRDDTYSEKFIMELNKNSVDASGIVTVPKTHSSICFVIVEDQTRENRCLFALGATATWKTRDFINAEQLGGKIQPDLVVAQMEIIKEVVELC